MKRKLDRVVINKLINESFKEGKLIESKVLKSITLLKSQSSTQAIYSLQEYLRELKRRQREHTLHIETVIPISPGQLKKIKRVIEKKVKITKVVTTINPEILGGVRLRVGDEIWDQSLLGKLNQVKEVIAHGRSN